MNIQETVNEGLKREYAVVVSAAEIAAKVEARVKTLAGQIRMPGFRPGKVPPHVVRQIHGQALTGEAVQELVNESTQKVIADNKLRPALQPSIDLKSFAAEADLEFTMRLEVLPQVTAPDITGLKLEKLTVPVADSQIDDALKGLADRQKSYETAPADHVAAEGDAVVIDFLGTVDGEAFEGGKGEGIELALGSGQFIPGFEIQLIGAKAGDQRTVAVTFPETYPVAYLKAKPAKFAVTVQEVKTAKAIEITDDLAKNLGMETLVALREAIKSQVEREHGSLARTYLKRKLLDQLAAAHDFAVPPSMVEAEFAQIWQQLEREVGDDEAEKAKLEGERAEYHGIAERRVRLGLLLSEVGQANDIQISQQEMNRLIYEEASRYPGQQEQVLKYFRENAGAAAQLRAPLYEEKVVDFILSKAEISEREVTREALQAAIEAEDGAQKTADVVTDSGTDEAHKPKKARSAKAKAASAGDDDAAAPSITE